MRLLASILATALAGGAAAQGIVTSGAPEAVSVTVYRDPDRSAEEAFELEWLDGYALITETRRVAIPAGDADIRFEGVAGGILPESAIIAGLPEGVVEKNQDAYLLSPGSLLDAALDRRVHLRRTSAATGAVTETEAVIRSGADGAVVLQTPDGFEALRCSGLPETLIYDAVPPGLSPKPTLSVRTRSAAAATATVTLSYLASGFDWQANYVADLSADGSHMELFAWLTLANGDETGFADAETLAVAGEVNREDEGDDDPPEALSLNLRCWPDPSRDYGGAGLPPPPPPPPPPAPMEAFYDGEDIIVTASRIRRSDVALIAEREDLGDLKLYRIPEPVTVAAKSQKQVALLSRSEVPVRTLYRFELGDEATRATLTTRNREQERLGLPLPAGPVAVFGGAGRRILLGEGFLEDRAVGEDVEIVLGESIDVRTTLVEESSTRRGDAYLLTVTNAKPRPVLYEALLGEGRVTPRGGRLVRRDGQWVWSVLVPANGSARLRFRQRQD